MKTALVYPRLRHQCFSFLPPLGLISLATVAKRAGFQVRLFDSSFDRGFSKLENELRRYEPDVVGFSVTSDLYPNARRLVAFAKSLGAVTLMGGPHPTIEPRQVLEECPALDIVVRGEAEVTIVELLRALGSRSSLAGLEGIAYKSGSEIIENAPRGWIEDLDTIPLPDRDLLPTYRRYSASGYTGLVLTRGCPFDCRFCQPALRTVAGRFRSRSPRRVADEIEQLYHRYRNRVFHVDDDLLVLRREWLREVSGELHERGLRGRLKFVVLSRVDVFDEELAEILRELGVWYVLFGVESGSQEVLDSLKKKITLDKTRAAFARAKRYGFRTHAFVILGSPAETRESLRETEELIAELDPTSVFLSLFVPNPGTHLRDELEQAHLVLPLDHRQVNYYSWEGDRLGYRSEHISFGDVVRTRDRILARRRLSFLLRNAWIAVETLVASRAPLQPLMLLDFYRKKKHFNG